MNSTWTLEVDGDGIGWLCFDLPGEKVNKFTTPVMQQLGTALGEAAGNASIKALVVYSGKKDSFVVGADIEELASIQDAAEAKEKAQAGQNIFQKLADLRLPTVAVVHGACMGGGMELALACDYRLVSDHRKTTLALPEVKLGILPGWGGTQRLPRLLGLSQAIGLILTGKNVVAKKAYKIGLADGLVADAFLKDQTRDFVKRIQSSKQANRVIKRRRRSRPWFMRFAEWLPATRVLIFRQAEKQTRRQTKGHYPAPLEALEVIKKTYAKSITPGLVIEAEGFSKLAPTNVSRNLLWIFKATRRAAKSTAVDGVDDSMVLADHYTKAAVVGAGVMGGGIAWALSQQGMTVRLKDVAWDGVAKGFAAASKMYDALVKRRKMTPSDKSMAMHRIEGTTRYSGFANLDVVIEAVFEDLEVKRTVLAEVEKQVGDHTLMCTNTSSLPITQIAEALRDPERFVGVHFFNPVNRMPLVEVIPGERTSPTAVANAVALARRLGKTPVVVADRPGFLVNRVLLPYVNESVKMFGEGVDPERLDRLIEEFGMPMGPLTLADEVGLDVGLKVGKVLEEAYGDRMSVAGVLDAAVKSGAMLGKKSGKGFFVYRRGKKSPNPQASKLVANAGQQGGSPRELSDKQVVDRAILTMVNEAARCLDEKIVDSAETLDIAMLMGTGFAPFRGGLLRWADQVGPLVISQRLRALAAEFGDRFTPAPLLERLAEGGGRFYDHQEAHEDNPVLTGAA